MKIYDVEGFPNPARVRIALAEKGASDKVEFIPVDVMGGEHRTPEFKAKNPDAAVPCLELEDGSHISLNATRSLNISTPNLRWPIIDRRDCAKSAPESR